MEKYSFSKQALMEIVKNQNGFAIEDIQQDDIKEVLILCAKVFAHVMNPEATVKYLFKDTNWDISKKAVYNGKIVGCYLLNETQIADAFDINDTKHMTEDLYPYTKKRGVQGVALAVLPEYRGASFGRALRDVPLHMGYDYIWGEHLEGLKNRDNWVNFGRRVVGEFPGLFVTLMDLK